MISIIKIIPRTNFSGLGYDYLGEKEFIELLNQNHIKTQQIPISCVRFPNDQYENCRKSR